MLQNSRKNTQELQVPNSSEGGKERLIDYKLNWGGVSQPTRVLGYRGFHATKWNQNTIRQIHGLQMEVEL